MSRRLLFLAAFVAAAVAVAPAFARDPLDEQRKLTRADNALAARILLQASDLPAGFARTQSANRDATLHCKARPNLSSYTITGEGSRTFTDRQHLVTLASAVQVFASLRDARGDFVDSAIPGMKACLEELATSEGLSVRSSTFSRSAGVGERAVRYHVVATLTTATGSVPLHLDVLAAQLGRVQATVMTIAPLRSPAGQKVLLALMAARAAASRGA